MPENSRMEQVPEQRGGASGPIHGMFEAAEDMQENGLTLQNGADFAFEAAGLAGPVGKAARYGYKGGKWLDNKFGISDWLVGVDEKKNKREFEANRANHAKAKKAADPFNNKRAYDFIMANGGFDAHDWDPKQVARARAHMEAQGQ